MGLSSKQSKSGLLVAAAFAVAACSGPQTMTPTAAPVAPSAMSHAEALHSNASAGYLYVGAVRNTSPSGAYVIEFAPNSSTAIVRTILLTSLPDPPSQMELDKSSNLYVLVPNLREIFVYPPGSTKAKYAIDGSPSNGIGSLALDSAGNVYAASQCFSKPYSLTVYAAGTTHVLRTANVTSCPVGMALDVQNNLYVSNNDGTAKVYKAGSFSILRTLGTTPTTQGGPIAVDRTGTVYWGIESAPKYYHGCVYVYAPGGTKIARIISNGAIGPGTFAIDLSNNLYVGNFTANSFQVSEYAPGQSTPMRTLVSKIAAAPESIATDAIQNVYVGEYNGSGQSNVTVWVPGTTRQQRTVNKGFRSVYSVAIGTK